MFFLMDLRIYTVMNQIEKNENFIWKSLSPFVHYFPPASKILLSSCVLSDIKQVLTGKIQKV